MGSGGGGRELAEHFETVARRSVDILKQICDAYPTEKTAAPAECSDVPPLTAKLAEMHTEPWPANSLSHDGKFRPAGNDGVKTARIDVAYWKEQNNAIGTHEQVAFVRWGQVGLALHETAVLAGLETNDQYKHSYRLRDLMSSHYIDFVQIVGTPKATATDLSNPAPVTQTIAQTYPVSVEANLVNGLGRRFFVSDYVEFLGKFKNAQLGFYVEPRDLGKIVVTFEKSNSAYAENCFVDEDVDNIRTMLSERSNEQVNIGIVKVELKSNRCKGFNLIGIQAQLRSTAPPKAGHASMYQDDALNICIHMADLGYHDDAAVLRECVASIKDVKFDPKKVRFCTSGQPSSQLSCINDSKLP